jgi:hypothetical protein
MLFSKINAALAGAEQIYAQLNGWRKIMINAVLLGIPLLDLFNDWIQTIAGVAGLVLLIWSIIKGWYQVELWKEDLKMKKFKREKEQQEWWDEREKRRKNPPE